MGLSHKPDPAQERLGSPSGPEPTLALSMGSVRKSDQSIKIFLTE
jgi:hypothetical protein